LQLYKKGLGLLQVRGVEPFREPAVGRREQISSLGSLSLLLPQPRQAHHRPELERLRLLAYGVRPAGNPQGSGESTG